MDTYYTSGKGIKFACEDNFENGEIGKSQMSEFEEEFIGDTAEEVVQKLIDYFDTKRKYVDLNSCDENGRIDISILENADGYKSSLREEELWKKDRLKLWSVTYSFIIRKVEEKEVILK